MKVPPGINIRLPKTTILFIDKGLILVLPVTVWLPIDSLLVCPLGKMKDT